MKTFSAIFIVLSALLAQSAHAQLPQHAQPAQVSAIAQRQDPAELRQTVEQFLRTQASGLPGDVSISVAAVDSRVNLPACALPEAFLPPGGRMWGKTAVGVRCNAPSAWTIYLTATVRVTGDYITAALPLTNGQEIGPSDLVTMRGDLTSLPRGVITDPAHAIGRTVTMSLQAGMPLRQDLLRSQRTVQQGQIVKLTSNGPGFQVSAEGRALGHGTEGQTVQARTANGQIVSGIAKAGGVVEVNF